MFNEIWWKKFLWKFYLYLLKVTSNFPPLPFFKMLHLKFWRFFVISSGHLNKIVLRIDLNGATKYSFTLSVLCDLSLQVSLWMAIQLFYVTVYTLITSWRHLQGGYKQSTSEFFSLLSSKFKSDPMNKFPSFHALMCVLVGFSPLQLYLMDHVIQSIVNFVRSKT